MENETEQTYEDAPEEQVQPEEAEATPQKPHFVDAIFILVNDYSQEIPLIAMSKMLANVAVDLIVHQGVLQAKGTVDSALKEIEEKQASKIIRPY